jgi:hypothetical protein
MKILFILGLFIEGDMHKCFLIIHKWWESKNFKNSHLLILTISSLDRTTILIQASIAPNQVL